MKKIKELWEEFCDMDWILGILLFILLVLLVFLVVGFVLMLFGVIPSDDSAYHSVPILIPHFIIW